jgi:hypothetical protein
MRWCPAMVTIPCGCAAFQWISDARIRRPIMKDGKVPMVPSQVSSRAAQVAEKAVEPAREERSNGAVDEYGSSTGWCAGAAGAAWGLRLANAMVIACSTLARAWLSTGGAGRGFATGASSSLSDIVGVNCCSHSRSWHRARLDLSSDEMANVSS